MKMKDMYSELIKEVLIRINLQNESIIGVLLYGSTVTGQNDILSDVDILFVTEDSSKQEGRGVIKVLGNRVEYFIKCETSVYKELLGELNSLFPALITAFLTGKIYYDRDNCMQQLRKRAQQVLEMPYIKL